MAMVEAVEMMAGRFRGCMVGALMGDCLGAPFEGEPRATRSILQSYFRRLSDPDLKVPYKQYTDDTAMTRCVAQSLIEKKGFDAKDMARSNVTDVFAALRATKFRDPYSPAAFQFNGRGSYGNGAAMRVAPVALFCYATKAGLVDTSRDTALITHANRLGYNGAVLQCLAIYEALHTPTNKLDSVKFIESLITKMKEIEKPSEDDILYEGEDPYVYVKRLEKVLELMERGDSVSREQVEDELGVYISAHMSVPTAIYSFIRATSPVADIESENEYQRTLHFAISLGGDTDTIASMAGSIAGAYYGVTKIPGNLQKHCEASSDAIKQADDLFSLSDPKPPAS
ncbi:ADP-ribose glycohydrolase ARH3-like [Homarus americanus]|uniref:ADP-ribosylhydrolase ARH3 n=1 Tax=Homarus americanus TaxID=6706 RepID=A0A8J5K7U8_HOMAM|nr:ADP-ribose glycohydrolase ARH3-like [Homarus americanus]